MSAPDTNVERQKRRHRGPLIGIAAAVLFGVVMVGVFVFDLVGEAPAPSDPAAATAPASGTTDATGAPVE